MLVSKQPRNSIKPVSICMGRRQGRPFLSEPVWSGKRVVASTSLKRHAESHMIAADKTRTEN